VRALGWLVVIVIAVMVLSKACVGAGGVPVLPEKFRDTVPTTEAPTPPKAESGGVPKIGDGLTPALPGVGPVGPALPPGVAGALKP
jgi:hypothetical protein